MTDDAKAAIGKRLRTLREAHELTQLEFSRLIDKSRSAVAQWETGKATPDIVDYPTIAFHLNSTPEYVAFGIKRAAGDAHFVNIVEYDPSGESRFVGEMAVPANFYRKLRRMPSAHVRAWTIPRDGMFDGCRAGDVVLVDEADRNVQGIGESFLIKGPEVTAVSVQNVPGSTMILVRAGSQDVRIPREDLPVIGRIVGKLVSAI